jgi:hypothetical protein
VEDRDKMKHTHQNKHEQIHIYIENMFVTETLCYGIQDVEGKRKENNSW